MISPLRNLDPSNGLDGGEDHLSSAFDFLLRLRRLRE